MFFLSGGGMPPQEKGVMGRRQVYQKHLPESTEISMGCSGISRQCWHLFVVCQTAHVFTP